ncbi:UTP--glucose-1-phosphate uridylyltransferase [Modestobacter roseus]|uniref:UTP--glucose-1-phosphate uridylyltransferase n=1 Tax=Modestobacter roseus TaxID=1181884 RepID=A0A562IKG2_9ACTN|nr:hypothetical protein [Modestobacter roseus]TWH71511.1 UTP--glucose-1-phosphate uridylyltransferase [Modestobacter roseus]
MDDIIDARDHLLEQMIAVQAEHGGAVIALLDVGADNISKYGAVAVETRTSPATPPATRSSGDRHGGEAPGRRGPSSLAIIGRYVLPPEVFPAIRDTPPGRGGEIQLTDALLKLVDDGVPVHGVVFSGRRYDTGDKLDYLKAVVRLASSARTSAPRSALAA